MHTSLALFEGITIMIIIILMVVLLKKIHLLDKDDSSLFSKIVLNLTLPAVIFSSLAVKSFNAEFIQMSAIMAVIEILMMIISFGLARMLKFDRGTTGALILVSSFGMTSLLGYPIIRQVFPDNALAMEEAVITSEFGVGLLLFIFGPIIAMYFSDSKVYSKNVIQSIKKFFVSPVFVAIVLGLLFSMFPSIKEYQLGSSVLRLFKLIGNANLLMVTLTIGLIIEFEKFHKLYLFLGLALFLKLFLKPLFAIYFTQIGGFTMMMQEIVFIETALPSAILTVIYARQYNCRPDLVSKAIVVTLLLSALSLSSLFAFFY